MYWKITAFNGSVLESYYGEYITDAINRFLTVYGLHQMDIKTIEQMQ